MYPDPWQSFGKVPSEDESEVNEGEEWEQRTEDRGQRTEDRGQRTEDRGQRTEMHLEAAGADVITDRGRNTEVDARAEQFIEM